jgi:transcriptional antiterminator NusG
MKVMEFSEQEEQALNSADESESVAPDSTEIDAEQVDPGLDSTAEDETSIESGASPAEHELPEADSDSSPENGEELEAEMSPEDILAETKTEGVETSEDASDAEQPEAEEVSPPDAEVSDPELEIADEKIPEPEADESPASEEVDVEQEEIAPQELSETDTAEAELPESKLESTDKHRLEPEIDESIVLEGAAALAAEIKSEPTPVLETEQPALEDDDSDLSLDFLDQDQAALEEEDGRSWFVVHCYSGYENKVRHNLEQRIETMGMKDMIFDIVVPTEEEIEVREGKRRTVERRVFPGYILVNMIMTEESWYVVRNTPGVTGFVGMGNQPTPLRPEEVSQIIKRMEAEAPRIKVTFKAGERVRIVDGPFNDFRGTVSEIDMERAKVRVMVNFFGRETPVELDFLQVEKT